MKSRSLYLSIAMIVLGLLACQPATAEQTKPVTETRPMQPPTRDLPALPTPTSKVSAQPTKTPRPPLPTITIDAENSQPAEYFTDIMEFDPLHSDFFTYQVIKGSMNSVDIEVDELAMWFELGSPNTSIIFLRNDLVYEEVNLTANVKMEDTQGAVKLICQYDPAIGWYEFNIRLDGTFNIRVALLNDNQVSYETLYEGQTSKTYKNGNTNEFSATCKSDELHFDFNRSKGWAVDVPETLPHILQGQIGFGVESEGSLPVKIGFEELITAEARY